jgi:hypothetical protein
MRRTRLSLPFGALLLLLSVAVAAAQGLDCTAALESFLASASDACQNRPSGAICNGGTPPQAEPQGAVSNALAVQGALVEAGVVHALHTPPIDPTSGTAGVAWLRLPAPAQATALLVGDVAARNVAPPDAQRAVSTGNSHGQRRAPGAGWDGGCARERW